MRIGIIGWPGAGKSTLFQALGGVPQPGHRGGTRADSWPLVSADVPDPRLEWLRELWQPRKYTPARIEFVDFPGLPRGEEKGRGELMAAVRDVDALCLVVRAFPDPSAERPEADPQGDLARLHSELLFGDYAAIAARVEKLEVQVRKPTKTQERDRRELALLARCLPELEAGRPLRAVAMGAGDRQLLQGYRFASEKPTLALWNVAEADLAAPAPPGIHRLCAPLEAEIAALAPAERRDFLAGYGLAEPFRDLLLRLGYETLGLYSFFTMGEDEVRAWTVQAGDSALVAAGRIHTDLARGFIRAEVTPWAGLHAAGSVKEAKAQGHTRLEGKEYVVQDGDILNIRFSV